MRRFQHSQVAAAVNSEKKSRESWLWVAWWASKLFNMFLMYFVFIREKDLHFGLLMTSRLRPEPINGFISEFPKLSMLSTWRWCRASLLVEFYNSHLTRRWREKCICIYIGIRQSAGSLRTVASEHTFHVIPSDMIEHFECSLHHESDEALVCFPLAMHHDQVDITR